MASKKAVLGRGLNALLPSTEEGAQGDKSGGDLAKSRLYNFEDRIRLLGRVADIEVDHIRPNPYQPRKNFDETALNELASSIEQLGIIQPITVRAMGGGQFEVISGERRLRAARRAGLKRIPAYVREADTEAMLEMALVENVQREELNPIEVAIGYQRLIEECQLTQERVAKKVGKNRTTIANFLRLLKLPPRIQASLRDNSISVGHARALISINNDAMQDELLVEILNTGLSVRDVEDRVRSWLKVKRLHTNQEKKPSATAKPTREDLQIQSFTSKLRTQLSTQVQIKHNTKNGSGRIELAYYSPDDLERILDILLQS